MIEGLEIRNASPPYKFTDKSGAEASYTRVVGGIFVQRGKHITIRGNVVHDNGNGLFVGSSGGEELTEHLLIEGNYVSARRIGTRVQTVVSGGSHEVFDL